VDDYKKTIRCFQGAGGAGEFFLQRPSLDRQQQRAVVDDRRLLPAVAQSQRRVRLFLNGEVRHSTRAFLLFWATASYFSAIHLEDNSIV